MIRRALSGARPPAWRPVLVALGLAGLAGLNGAAMAQETPFAVAGLKIGDTIAEARRAAPGLRVADVPYIDPVVEEDYRIITGRLAILGYNGRASAPDGSLVLTTTFTGDETLFSVRLERRRGGPSCAETQAGLLAQYGLPVLDQRPEYLLWRRVVVLGPQLEFRCLNPAAGAYSLTLSQPLLQQLFVRKLRRELESAIFAASQFIR